MPVRLLLFVLALTVYLVGATEFMIAPMLTPLADAFHTTPASAAWLVSAYACAYAIGAPFIGRHGDRLDRWRLLKPALLLFALDSLALTIAPTFALAIACRILGGLASATLIPTTFALVSDVVPHERRAGAMGLVMFGMTLGIATGPACAGLLTHAFGWRAPFIAVAAGCLAVFAIAQTATPAAPAVVLAGACSPSTRSRHSIARALDPTLLALLTTKAAWLGLAVAGFLLSGEWLRARFALDTAQVGSTVAIFGIGLGIGNLITGHVDRLIGRADRTLLSVVALLLVTIAAFYLTSPPLPAAIATLGAWGLALGIAAPVSTALLSTHAAADTGFVLALSESLNNLVLLALLPLGARLIAAASAHP